MTSRGVAAPADASSPVDGHAIDRLVAALGDDAVPARQAAVRSIAELNADAVPAIADRLARLRASHAAERPDPRAESPVLAVVREARKAPIAAGVASDAFELADTLAASPAAGTPAGHEALVVASLMRALVHVGTTPAVRALLATAADANGAFRPDLGRAVKALGDRAVPALLEARASQSADVRRWSANQLEAMAKRIPADAVQTRSNEVLADVLEAFATLKDPDALSIVLSFVNSDRVQVRLAARDAIARYGSDVTTKLREAYANLTGKPAPDSWSVSDTARELFAAYDRSRLQEVYSLIDDGVAKEKSGDAAGAVAAFDRVLARQPLIERRREMVPAYVAYAESLSERDPQRALAAYRKASRLNPEEHRVGQIESAVAYLEANELRARGVDDAEAYRRAVLLDPANLKARAVLDELESAGDQRHERIRRIAGAAAVLFVAVVGIILFGGRRRRPGGRAPAP